MTEGLEMKTLQWTYEGAIEPPRVVHIRTTHMVSKDNIYAQVTVRLYTQQVQYTGVFNKLNYIISNEEYRTII